MLDTNVVAEPLRPRPDPSVLAWLDRQASTTLFLTATSLAELLVGAEILPEGRRRMALQDALREVVRTFGDRVLPFDREAAAVLATITARARRRGRTLSFGDGQIAAIALARGFQVASRDTGPFEAAEVPVIDPWMTGMA